MERFLEANQRGYRQANKETIDKFKELYLQLEGDIENG